MLLLYKRDTQRHTMLIFVSSVSHLHLFFIYTLCVRESFRNVRSITDWPQGGVPQVSVLGPLCQTQVWAVSTEWSLKSRVCHTEVWTLTAASGKDCRAFCNMRLRL